MAVAQSTTRVEITEVAGVEARPGWTLIGSDGNDWSWAYVIHRPIPGYIGYLVGSDGSVWTCKHRRGWLTDTWRRLTPTTNPKGYRWVTICEKQKRRNRALAAMVLESFIGPRPTGHDACHQNDTRDDNRLENLRWDTHARNVAQRNERNRQATGSRVGCAKLDESDIFEIRQLHANCVSLRKIGRRFGVAGETIRQIIHGNTWQHVPRTIEQLRVPI